MTIRDLIDQIQSEHIRTIVREVLNNDVPKCFRHNAASSTGKYHPSFSLGEGGLMRHTAAVGYFATRIADAWDCTDHEKDIVLGAALLHDGLKQKEGEIHTNHEHPLLMANCLRKKYKDDPDAEEMATIIESHMGRWNTSNRSKVVLPKPQTKLQYLLSAADMCAATREIKFPYGFFGESKNG